MLCMGMATPAAAQAAAPWTPSWPGLCDTSFEDCRAPILKLIQDEDAGIDVSFWFMTDTDYSTEIIKRWKAGVPVRVLLDLRADANYPANAVGSADPHHRRHPDPTQDDRRASTTGR